MLSDCSAPALEAAHVKEFFLKSVLAVKIGDLSEQTQQLADLPSGVRCMNIDVTLAAVHRIRKETTGIQEGAKTQAGALFVGALRATGAASYLPQLQHDQVSNVHLLRAAARRPNSM